MSIVGVVVVLSYLLCISLLFNNSHHRHPPHRLYSWSTDMYLPPYLLLLIPSGFCYRWPRARDSRVERSGREVYVVQLLGKAATVLSVFVNDVMSCCCATMRLTDLAGWLALGWGAASHHPQLVVAIAKRISGCFDEQRQWMGWDRTVSTMYPRFYK